MSGPTVSIIIPCYNGEEFVSEAIESALDQSYPFKEVIVIDDGSTDNSLSVIKKFGRGIRWKSGPNWGGGAARNLGLSLTNGEYVQFHDADDLLDPKKLEKQVPVLLESGADLVYSDWRQFHIARPDREWICRVVPQCEDSVILALQKQNITTNSPLHRKKSLMDVGGFRENLPCCQERDLHLRLACRGARFFYLPEVLHTVRQRCGSVSNYEVRVRWWLHKILVEIYHELEEKNDLSDDRKLAFATLIASNSRRLLRFGHRKSAMEQFRTAFRMHHSGGLAGAYSRFGYYLVKLTGPERAESILMPLKKLLAIFTG